MRFENPRAQNAQRHVTAYEENEHTRNDYLTGDPYMDETPLFGEKAFPGVFYAVKLVKKHQYQIE